MEFIRNYRLIFAGALVSTIFGFMFTSKGLDVLEPFHLLGFCFALAYCFYSY